MRVIKYDNLSDYMEDTFDLLKKHELQNNLIIGNCVRAKKQIISSENWVLAVVLDDTNSIKLISMITPPYPLLIFEVDNIQNDEALNSMVDYLIDNQIQIPGVVTEKELAKRFVDNYKNKVAINVKPGMNMRIYQLDEVKYRNDAKGNLREATQQDLFYLPYWAESFAKECNLHNEGFILEQRYERVKSNIDHHFLYIYEDEYPVSQVAAGRETLNGVVINNVYTPPYYRMKGYATAMMADVCTLLLSKGYKFCSLFTDLANPISNSIYQKVGFYPVCDYDEHWFEYEN